MPTAPPSPPQSPVTKGRSLGRRVAVWLLRIVVIAAVFWWSADVIVRGVGQLSTNPPPIDWLPLVAAGFAYILGFSAMAWFWRETLRALDQPSQWRDVAPAYFLGHLGKYAPGKLLVVVLRTSAIRRAGGQTAPIAISVFIDTITLMAVGAVIACVLIAANVQPGKTYGFPDQRTVIAAAVVLGVLACLPTAPPVLRRLIKPLAPAPSRAASRGVTWRLTASGWSAALVTWTGLALSVWFVVRAITPALEFSPPVLLQCLLTASLPMVAGFLVFVVPGGLGVRDKLVAQLLASTALLPEPTAAAAAVLLRLVWIGSEIVACVMLVVWRRVVLRSGR